MTASVDRLVQLCASDALWEVKQLMVDITPEDLAPCEAIAVLTILRVAHERWKAQQTAPAPVLRLVRKDDPPTCG